MKKNKKTEKVMKRSLAVALAFSMAAVNPFPMNEEVKAESKPVTADIYPNPQSVEYTSEEGMSFEGKVNVVMHGEQEHATEAKLDEILKANGIDYEITDRKDDTKANIIISSDNTHCDECAVDDLVFSNKEAYILTTSNDTNSKGEVTIVGSDEDGAYYGVLSLAQILEQNVDGKFAELVVKDYPEIEFRGFIEGFYGYPWSHEDRMSLMKDTGKYKMNTYIYAPKDDPYHRAQWRTLYPEKEAQQIAELAQAGKDSNFNFCWTIHPGDSLDLYSESDFSLVLQNYGSYMI